MGQPICSIRGVAMCGSARKRRIKRRKGAPRAAPIRGSFSLALCIIRFAEEISRLGDAGRITTQLGTPRGRYDKHSSKFFPQ
jgi:hypothetical protein